MKTTRPFHFKEFSIQQSQGAMKVTLDACLFAALVAEQSKQAQIHRTLDIGAGTGLLSLMLAQGIKSPIDAIEIDSQAYREAEGNARNSPFSDRVHLFNTPIEEFSSNSLYDLIICNPPFFTNGLKGPNDQRNQARHNDSLTFESLSDTFVRFLSDNGKAWLLLPVKEMDKFEEIAQPLGLTVSDKWQVKSQASKKAYRNISCFTRQSTTNVIAEHELTVRKPSNEYTESFKALMAPYYLKL